MILNEIMNKDGMCCANSLANSLFWNCEEMAKYLKEYDITYLSAYPYSITYQEGLILLATLFNNVITIVGNKPDAKKWLNDTILFNSQTPKDMILAGDIEKVISIVDDIMSEVIL